MSHVARPFAAEGPETPMKGTRQSMRYLNRPTLAVAPIVFSIGGRPPLVPAWFRRRRRAYTYPPAGDVRANRSDPASPEAACTLLAARLRPQARRRLPPQPRRRHILLPADHPSHLDANNPKDMTVCQVCMSECVEIFSSGSSFNIDLLVEGFQNSVVAYLADSNEDDPFHYYVFNRRIRLDDDETGRLLDILPPNNIYIGVPFVTRLTNTNLITEHVMVVVGSSRVLGSPSPSRGRSSWISFAGSDSQRREYFVVSSSVEDELLHTFSTTVASSRLLVQQDRRLKTSYPRRCPPRKVQAGFG